MKLNPIVSHNTFYCIFTPEKKVSGAFNEAIVQFNNAGGDTGTPTTMVASRIKLIKESVVPRIKDIVGTLVVCPIVGKLSIQTSRDDKWLAAGSIYTDDGITILEHPGKKSVVVAADENIVNGEVTPYLAYYDVNEGANS